MKTNFSSTPDFSIAPVQPHSVLDYVKQYNRQAKQGQQTQQQPKTRYVNGALQPTSLADYYSQLTGMGNGQGTEDNSQFSLADALMGRRKKGYGDTLQSPQGQYINGVLQPVGIADNYNYYKQQQQAQQSSLADYFQSMQNY
jgi:hypothetical protein